MKVIRERNLWFLALGQSVSLFGDRINNMALLALLGTRYTHSTFAFSGLAVFISLPAIILSPLSGVIADKFDRKKTMLVMELFRALLVVLIPLLFSLFANILIVYSLVFLLYTFTVIYNNAKMSLIPEVIKDRRNLWDFNALLNVSGKLAIALGTVFGGVLVDLYVWKKLNIEGWKVGFYIDALTYLFSALMVYLITVETAKRVKKIINIHAIMEEEKSVLRRTIEDIKFALSMVFRRGVLKFFYLSILNTMLLLAVVYNLYLPYIQQGLGFGTKGIGFVTGAAGLGLLVGSMMFSRIAGKFGEITSITTMHILLSIIVVSSLFFHSFLAFLILFFIGGVFIAPLLLSYDTFLQRVVPTTFRGKMFAFREFMWSSSFLTFVLILGFVSEVLKGFVGFENAVRIIIILSVGVIVFLSLILLKLLPKGVSR